MQSMKKHNGKDYVRWVLCAIAIASIVWNAATLHNDVGHLKSILAEIKQDNKQIKNDIEKIHITITRIDTELSERKKENG